MNWRKLISKNWRHALTGAAWSVGLGLLLLGLGGWPVILSYDLLFAFRPPQPRNDVVIVYLDDRSFKELGQLSTPNWDRNLHAQLLDRLTADGCRLVVFDIVFSEPGTPEANTDLARAMRANGKVVLAAALNYPGRAQISTTQPLLPLPEFMDAAAGWGIAELDVTATPGRVARQYFVGTEHHPALPRVAARVAGVAVPSAPSLREPKPWLNYYGPPLSLPYFSFADVTNQPAGTFANKVVFVGARPTTLKAMDEADQFRTPYTLWRREFSPGVEIGATAFLNLVRNDALHRLARGKEILFLSGAGILLGGLIGLLRPLAAGGLALAGATLILLLAIQSASSHLWIPWTVVVFAQLPVALAWSLRGHFHRLKFEKEVLERTLVETSRQAEAAKSETKASGLEIPDHTMLRCVGKGAYGDVWLARNAIGVFHAVKIVRRRDFPNDTPYEREFKGIQKFMPISRSHPGFVNVLHVGRNDTAGFFFYIMEAADDQRSGPRIDPERYVPKTLSSELVGRGKLSPEETLQLGVALSLALAHLHEQQLVHRDIKPGNIIYVNGAPKFADIGLVTEQSSEAKDVSLVGTEGYVPPEGPGSPPADVYALGKVLYEACMGRDRQLFPEVPTTIWEQPDDALVRRLNAVIGKACATSVADRYASAKELRAALAELHGVLE
jgi:CHASE2 domain-containing sensor protein